jgi:hypothetical protein
LVGLFRANGFYNFTKDKKRMISSAQNEAILWDMTTYDTLKIFRNTGGFAYYFNVKDEDKIHYIKDNKMNTYSLSSGNVTSYNIKISDKNSGYARTMATMADGENIIFVETIGGTDIDNRDFEGLQIYKTNTTTQTSTLLFLQKFTCFSIISISVELQPILKISTPSSIASCKSLIVENPGML